MDIAPVSNVVDIVHGMGQSVELLHLEDFAVGQIFALGPRVVSRDEIIAFAAEFDPQPFHLDEVAAKSSVLGGLAASGWHTSAILIRLICDAFLSRSAVLGSKGMDHVRWLKPVYAEELHGELKITGLRRSRTKANTGILMFEAFLADNRNVRKIEMAGMFFLRTRTP